MGRSFRGYGLMAGGMWGTKCERAGPGKVNGAFLITICSNRTRPGELIVHRGFKFKLQPTAEQQTLFSQFAGVCRFIYNLALEQREKYRDTYEYTGGRVNFAQQCRELTMLRAEVDWIGAVPSTPQTQALRDLDKAFSDFFAGRKGYPTRRVKGVNDSFRCKGIEVSIRPINEKWAMVRIPRVGWVKFRSTRATVGEIKNATIVLNATGWHVSFACEAEIAPVEAMASHVGIDRGVATTLMLSNGEAFVAPDALNTLDRRHRAAQRVLARRKKGSARRRKALARCVSLSARRARIRKDWQHKTSRLIANQFGTVVMEDLRIASMTASAKGTTDAPGTGVRQKAGLNRSILNQGWGDFAAILAYKLEEQGGSLVLVNPAYT